MGREKTREGIGKVDRDIDQEKQRGNGESDRQIGDRPPFLRQRVQG